MNLISIIAPRFHRGILLPLVLLTLASIAAAADAPAKSGSEGKASPATTTVSPAAGQTNFLILRNNRSWNRKPDFEDSLTELGYKFEVKTSAEISSTDLSKYRTIVIPGSQRKDDFYGQYMENTEAFDRYVTGGGTLLLELNGAENSNLPLPRGVRMARHGAKENSIILTNHPLVDPLGGQPIHASYASHGYLEGTPSDALVLATEMESGKPLMNKPTYVEYTHGKGRVIAACQCFHDQDGSGRGILMETAIVYTADRQWFAPKK